MNGNFESRTNLHGPDDQELGAALRALPRVSPPGLTTSLRVLASRERQRRLAAQSGLRGRLAHWGDRLSLHAGNLMRPLALPVAGGVCSAVVLFGIMLGSTYTVSANTNPDLDVPTMLSTSASINQIKSLGPIHTWDDSDVVVVDVILDDQGRMIDYAIVSGAAILADAAMRRSLENKLLFTEFVPATQFGVPTTSRLYLRVGTSRVEVKG